MARFSVTFPLMQVNADRANGEFTGPPGMPESYFDVIEKVSRLKRVMAVRIFDESGQFVNAFPAYITEAELPEDDLALLQASKPARAITMRTKIFARWTCVSNLPRNPRDPRLSRRSWRSTSHWSKKENSSARPSSSWKGRPLPKRLPGWTITFFGRDHPSSRQAEDL